MEARKKYEVEHQYHSETVALKEPRRITVAPGSARLRRKNITARRLAQLPSTATKQFDLCVIAPIREASLDELREILDRIRHETISGMRGEDQESPLLKWTEIDSLHYARFVIIEAYEPLGTGPLLAFSTNYDGPLGSASVGRKKAQQAHLEQLARVAGGALDSIYRCCEGYSGLNGLEDYLASHRVSARTFYVGSSGRTRDQILGEAELTKLVHELLDDLVRREPHLDPETVRERILSNERIKELKLPPFAAQPDRVFRVYVLLAGLAVAGAGVVSGFFSGILPLQIASGSVLAALGLAALTLRHKEKSDPEFLYKNSEAERSHIERTSIDENLFIQNELTHLVDLKPGWFRKALIESVFAALRLLIRDVYNQGKLGNIPSIHFARWCRIDKGRRLLFFSNFDNSWESYLGDFINQASSGLTGVWSNTVEYPRTRWLINAGSKDADRFKAWTRHYQIRTQAWYSAYPNLSIRNVNANTAIRRGIADPRTMSARVWLDWLQSVDRKTADELYEKEQKKSSMKSSPREGHTSKDKHEPLDLHDVQGLLLRGYGKKAGAEYLMMRVEPDGHQSARRWLSRLPLTHAHGSKKEAAENDVFINVAFTHRGLLALGVQAEIVDDFPTAFVQGGAHPSRCRINGDVGENAPENWQWGRDADSIHVLLMVFGSTEEHGRQHADVLEAEAREAGLSVTTRLQGGLLPGRKEHFGFRDGIAQPAILGSGKGELAYNTVNPGEMLLGHKNGYDLMSYCPGSAVGSDFGKNGSYLVFRQLSQDVDRFWSYCRKQAQQLGSEPTTVASKMIGRWPSGAPLVKYPDADPGGEVDEDRFAYLAKGQQNDRDGAKCPFGSHLRRSNPRDWELGADRHESMGLANLHRIMRRGRPYGKPFDPELDVSRLSAGSIQGDSEDRGFHFLAFNADFERQFEFVQQQWLQNPTFAGLSSSPDPAVGTEDAQFSPSGPQFTIQADSSRTSFARCLELSSFVRVKGSAYFFMPSISTVKGLGG